MINLFDLEYTKDFDGNILNAKYQDKTYVIDKAKIEKKDSWIDMVTDGPRKQRTKLETQMEMYVSMINRSVDKRR